MDFGRASFTVEAVSTLHLSAGPLDRRFFLVGKGVASAAGFPPVPPNLAGFPTLFGLVAPVARVARCLTWVLAV